MPEIVRLGGGSGSKGHSLTVRRDPRSKGAMGWTGVLKMGVWVHAYGRSSDRLDKEMAAGIQDVVSVAPHMGLTNKRRSKADSPSVAGVVGHPVVWVNVPAVDWRSLAKDDVPQRDVFSQVSYYFVL